MNLPDPALPPDLGAPAAAPDGRPRAAAAGPVRVKICGLRDAADVEAAAVAGAAYVGFVFFPPSPRALVPADARIAALAAPPGLVKVGLFVNPDDALLDSVLETVPLDMLQLHGAETPERVASLRARHGLPVMKAIGVRVAADLDAIAAYAGVADQLLIDAKPPEGAILPGGNGLAFDWSLLAGRRFPLPWLLAGGLTPENAAEAVARTGARQLDVSSGVESAPGVKDPARIRAFLAAVA
ncbi:MAG: phosphoribosylanthranilate isomerase [Pseudomonadota bacterium]